MSDNIILDYTIDESFIGQKLSSIVNILTVQEPKAESDESFLEPRVDFVTMAQERENRLLPILSRRQYQGQHLHLIIIGNGMPNSTGFTLKNNCIFSPLKLSQEAAFALKKYQISCKSSPRLSVDLVIFFQAPTAGWGISSKTNYWSNSNLTLLVQGFNNVGVNDFNATGYLVNSSAQSSKAPQQSSIMIQRLKTEFDLLTYRARAIKERLNVTLYYSLCRTLRVIARRMILEEAVEDLTPLHNGIAMFRKFIKPELDFRHDYTFLSREDVIGVISSYCLKYEQTQALSECLVQAKISCTVKDGIAKYSYR